jgi:hypothetical protein
MIGKPARERLTLIRVFEELRSLGYEGGYDAVRRYARAWGKERAGATAAAYVPLTFAPGEAYQFDWSHEIVVMDGVTTIVKVAHVRLCHSRMMLARAHPRETQEMVFDAHERAFAFFRGTCSRGIYDNMKTARGGTTVTAGLPHPDKRMALAPVTLVAEERTLKGSYIGSAAPLRDVPRLIALFKAGKLPVDALLTHRLGLEEINEGFDRLREGIGVRQVVMFG